jgi:hypothetical protein
MIYSNKNLEVSEKEVADFKIKVVSLGERGRGRKEIALCVPEGVQTILGNVKELTIGQTKTGKPRINKGETGMFLLLDTKMGYTRRCDGCIKMLTNEKSKVKILAEGNSADGDAGRIGTAATMVIEVIESCWIKLIYGGGSLIEFLYCDINDKFVTKIKEDDMDVASEFVEEIPVNWADPEEWKCL